TLEVGERTVDNLEIGLMVGSTLAEKGLQPYAMLGLSLPRLDPTVELETPSLLEQLVSAGEIPHSTISIHVSKLSRGLSGQLVLGESMPQSKDTTLLPLREASYYDDTLDVVVSAVRVRSSSSSSSPMIELPEVGLSVGIDTGADVSAVPEKLFSMLWEAIEKEFGRERVDGTRMVRSQPIDGKTDAIIDHHDQFWCRKSVAKRLPAIIIQVDVKSTFEVHLSNHVNVCEGEWCMLSVIDRVNPNEPFDALILGGPFFIDHDVFIDFDDGVVGIKTRSEESSIDLELPGSSKDAWGGQRTTDSAGTPCFIELFRGRMVDDVLS
ncbi:hypothetical protein FOZ62_012207, partial [Perkinsus olseni]